VRAVKTNAFVWAILVIVIGLDEKLALPAAIIGLVLALMPLLFAPRLHPVHDQHGNHDGVTYRTAVRSKRHPIRAPFPSNPTPGGNGSYTSGSWS